MVNELDKAHCADRYKTHSDKYTSVERWHHAVVQRTNNGTTLCKIQTPDLPLASCTPLHSSVLLLPQSPCMFSEIIKMGESRCYTLWNPNSVQALLIAPILVFTQSNYSGPLGLSFSKRRKRISKCARSTDQ